MTGKAGAQKRKKFTLRFQLHSVYFLALLIPLAILGTVLLFWGREMLTDHYTQLLESNNQRVRTLLSEVTAQAYEISSDVCYDGTVKKLLSADYDSSASFVSAVNHDDTLDQLVYEARGIASVRIYTDNPTVKNYKQFRCVTDEVAQSQWYQKALDYSNAFWTAIQENTYSSTQNDLCLVRKMNLVGSDYQAVIVIRVSDAYIRSRVNSDNIIDAVSVDEEGIVYSSRKSWYGQPQIVDIDYTQEYFRYSGTARVEDAEHLVSVSTIHLNTTGSKLYVCTVDSTGLADIESIMRSWTVILLLAILLPGAILVIFSNYFSGRVNRLRQEMHKARLQDYNIITELGGNDELSEAFEDLKFMVQDIKAKNARMLETELNHKELQNKQQIMEYKMLAGQINPHYLYNTLETIRMKALTTGDREVADAIKILGKTLHYVQENTGTSFTTLKKELEHVENYLSIQKLRFGDRVSYTIDIQPGLDPASYSVLPLLLQPVVENAVVHGLESVTGTGLITISVVQRDGVLQIDVRDSGVGMSEKQLREIVQGLDAQVPPKSSIALYNIHQRIRLCCGDGFGLEVESEEGRGTCVRLRLSAESPNI